MRNTESTNDQIRRMRELNEGEKLSLIFSQQRQLDEYQERIHAFECNHKIGSCPLCRDKDLTILRLQQQNEILRNKLFGRSSERSGKDKSPKKKGRGNPKGGASKRTRLRRLKK